jgi:hypothetical protein
VAVSTAGEGYAFFQGLDVASNGHVDVGYQALIAKDATTYGTGNAAIGLDGTGPAVAKPAPGNVCPAEFGDSDVYVSKVAS